VATEAADSTERVYWRWHALLSRFRQTKRTRSIGPRTLPGRVSKAEIEERRRITPDDGKRRLPLTRAECSTGPRPCPLVSCRHHLYLDVSPSGNVRLNFPDIQPEDMVVSCSLDLADEGPLTLDQLAQVMNLTRERARQVQDLALARIECLMRDAGLDETMIDVEVVSPWDEIWT
jgi:hypothetical protein